MDISSTRNALFNRILEAHGQSAKPTDIKRQAAPDYDHIGRHRAGPRPETRMDGIDHFEQHIVGWRKRAFSLARAKRGVPLRGNNVISWSSGIGDIKRTVVLGTHDPYRMHLIVVKKA